MNKVLAAERTARTRAYTTEMWEFRQKIARENADDTKPAMFRTVFPLSGRACFFLR